MSKDYTVLVTINTTVTVEVTATWNVAENYAEISDIRLPMQPSLDCHVDSLSDDDRAEIDESVRLARKACLVRY